MKCKEHHPFSVANMFVCRQQCDGRHFRPLHTHFIIFAHPRPVADFPIWNLNHRKMECFSNYALRQAFVVWSRGRHWLNKKIRFRLFRFRLARPPFVSPFLQRLVAVTRVFCVVWLTSTRKQDERQGKCFWMTFSRLTFFSIIISNNSNVFPVFKWSSLCVSPSVAFLLQLALRSSLLSAFLHSLSDQINAIDSNPCLLFFTRPQPFNSGRKNACAV